MSGSTDAFGARILIVDDQEANVRLLEYAIRRGGFVNVTSTRRPQEVTALHIQNRYALIILDLQMPGMSGFDVMEELKRVAGEDRVAILVMSADPYQMRAAMAAGATGFLGKPFVFAEMLLRVHLMLDKPTAADTVKPAPPVAALA